MDPGTSSAMGMTTAALETARSLSSTLDGSTLNIQSSKSAFTSHSLDVRDNSGMAGDAGGLEAIGVSTMPKDPAILAADVSTQIVRRMMVVLQLLADSHHIDISEEAQVSVS